jgi:preprotein translocase subunit SecG
MIKRSQIEKILRVNGVSTSSPDEHIRSVLLSARFNKDEVDTAIMVLRENKTTKQIRVDGLHKVFRTDEALRPNEISELLGIEVDASTFYRPQNNVGTLAGIQYVTVWLFSVFFAVVTVLSIMYMNEVGPFHPSKITQQAEMI